MNREAYSIRWKLHQATAALDYSLECFGDELAKKNCYPKSVDGFDAVYLYLANKHGWPISTCRAMSRDDLRLALADEMQGWIMPRDARFGLPAHEGVEVVIERE
ncbi:hypothetical protein [Candidatus Symbiopectobacterium sp. NZEC135]|uniref:hypothetical protein n=1 Tax=Candidatus Symbiopectobacterium sp. NZEC135 TaxID=2820471 RepID=UPI002226BA23|nr:hypothetical protein [Candidatus Symbiopectobacterium sp. NZEC135]MCW2482107.1 hypothetical protein [Candidatus Symbiopectobacterium sp. NZEC135]